MVKLEAKTLLAGLFVCALLIRFVSWWALPDPILSTNASIAYLGGADLLINGDGFSDPSYPIFTPPLYALIIAMLRIAFSDDQISVKALQIICDSFTVLLIYLIFTRAFSNKVALISAAAWVVYPFAIYPTIYIGPETIFTFLLCSFVLMLLRSIESDKWHDFFIAGLILGFATLLRGTTQFLPLLLPILLVLSKSFERRIWWRYIVLCLGFALVILPWGVRNYIVLGNVIPVANASGVFLWGATDKFLTIDERNRELPVYYEKLRARGIQIPETSSSLPKKDRFQFKAAVEAYKEQFEESPLQLVGFLIRKAFRVWYATESGNGQGLIVAINLPIYGLAIIGIIIALGNINAAVLLMTMIIGYFELLHAVSLPLFRYMIPIMPFVLGLASLTAVLAYNQYRGMHRSLYGNIQDSR